MIKTYRARLLSIVALVGLGAYLSVGFGCTKQTTDDTKTAVETKTIVKVGYVPIADCLPLYVAVEKGLFAKHGLDVQLTSLQSGQRIIEAMGSGDLQMGIANVVSVATAHARGVPVISITGGAVEVPDRPTKALLVSASSKIKSANDLVGKTVAVNGLKNIEHFKLRQYLELHKVPVDKVNVVEAPFPQMEGVLKAGSVQAVMAIEPYLSLAVKHGDARVLGHPYLETSPKTYVSSYVVMRSWLDAHQDAAKAFAQAIAEATDFINANIDESRQIVLKYNKLPDEVASEVTLPQFEAYFDAANLQPMMDELLKQGILPNAVQASEVFKRF